MRHNLEPAVAAAVAHHIGRRFVADRQCRRRPQIAAVEVADIEHFAGTIADRIVRPGRELIVATVVRPGIPAALDRDLEAEGRVGDDIDPRSRRRLAGAQHGHVFPAIGREAAEAVEELQRRPGRDRRAESPRAGIRRRSALAGGSTPRGVWTRLS